MNEELRTLRSLALTSWPMAIFGLLILCVGGTLLAQEGSPDLDRGVWLFDSDSDGFPDLTEERFGTDPFDPEDHPARLHRDGPPTKVGFPTSSCRTGYQQVGNRLCISEDEQDDAVYLWAAKRCRTQHGRVCSYEDLRYLYNKETFDADYDPMDKWLGDFVDEDTVLCGNEEISGDGDSDQSDFDGTCDIFSPRNFWCCHDLE